MPWGFGGRWVGQSFISPSWLPSASLSTGICDTAEAGVQTAGSRWGLAEVLGGLPGAHGGHAFSKQHFEPTSSQTLVLETS